MKESPFSWPKETLLKQTSESLQFQNSLQYTAAGSNKVTRLDKQGVSFGDGDIGNRSGRPRTGLCSALERNILRQTTERPLLHPLLQQIRRTRPPYCGGHAFAAVTFADPPSEFLARSGAAAAFLGRGRRPRRPCCRLQACPEPGGPVCSQ